MSIAITNEPISSNDEGSDIEDGYASVIRHRRDCDRDIPVVFEGQSQQTQRPPPLPATLNPHAPRLRSPHSQSQHFTYQHETCIDPQQRQSVQILDHLDEPEELPSVIALNVGGHRFMTRLSTLRKYEDSMLSAMFSGRHKLDKDRNGYYFLDSNGAFFGFILDFIRHETLPPNDLAVQVYKEACYYNIPPLVDKLQAMPSVAKMIVKEAHRAQFPDYLELKSKVIRIAMDNATVDKVGEVIIHAYRKEFIPRATYFNVNHECVSDQAHINVGPWDSAADEEILIKCLETDFLDEGFNIKTHEQKRRCKYYNGQNCQKSIYKITFIFA